MRMGATKLAAWKSFIEKKSDAALASHKIGIFWACSEVPQNADSTTTYEFGGLDTALLASGTRSLLLWKKNHHYFEIVVVH
jgi:hypothetical protein